MSLNEPHMCSQISKEWKHFKDFKGKTKLKPFLKFFTDSDIPSKHKVLKIRFIYSSKLFAFNKISPPFSFKFILS
jgi:hypothetical protein